MFGLESNKMQEAEVECRMQEAGRMQNEEGRMQNTATSHQKYCILYSALIMRDS